MKVPAGQAAKVDSWYGNLLYIDESDPIKVVKSTPEPIKIPEVVETPEILKFD